jgi:hypothetical protein
VVNFDLEDKHRHREPRRSPIPANVVAVGRAESTVIPVA